MTFLLLQTFAWLSAAFLIGAILGCLARRMFGARADASAMVPAGATAAAAGVAAAATQRTSVPAVPRAPVIEARTAPAPVTPPAPTGGIQTVEAPYSYPITTVGIPRPVPDPIQPQIQKIELAPATQLSASTAATESTGATSYPITTIGLPGYVMPAATVAATATAIAAAASAAADPITTVGIPGAAPAQAAEPARRDPLPSTPAQPRPEPLRPELARATQPPAADPAAPIPSTPAAVAGPVAASSAALSAVAARAQSAGTGAAPSSGDDLTRIRTIDSALFERLTAAGVTRFSDIAKWTPADVARVSQSLGLVGRIEQENWIEQAQILSSGAETDYSRRRQRGELTTSPTPAPSAAPVQAEPPRGATVSAMSERASALAAAAAAAASAAAAARTTAEPPLPTRLSDAIRENTKPATDADTPTAPRPDLSGLRSVRSEALRGDVTASETLRNGGSTRPVGAYDDLKRIRGVGVLIEKKLNSLGVNTYEQVANWTNADIDRVSQILDFKGRIERESWVEQARILASGGATDFSKKVDRGEA